MEIFLHKFIFYLNDKFGISKPKKLIIINKTTLFKEKFNWKNRGNYKRVNTVICSSKDNWKESNELGNICIIKKQFIIWQTV